jgi:hypothetical protein
MFIITLLFIEVYIYTISIHNFFFGQGAISPNNKDQIVDTGSIPHIYVHIV